MHSMRSTINPIAGLDEDGLAGAGVAESARTKPSAGEIRRRDGERENGAVGDSALSRWTRERNLKEEVDKSGKRESEQEEEGKIWYRAEVTQGKCRINRSELLLFFERFEYPVAK